jgi:hypothetical protein
MQTKTKKTDGKNSISKNQLVNWKLYIILLIASIFGTIAVLPYTLTLQGGLLQNSQYHYTLSWLPKLSRA